MRSFTLLLLLQMAQVSLAQEAISGYYPIEALDYWGNDIPVNGSKINFVASATACSTICDSLSNCAGFGYNPTTTLCYPKSQVVAGNPSDVTGTKTYIKLPGTMCELNCQSTPLVPG